MNATFCCSTLCSLTVLSALPEAKYLPSGENAIELTHSLCSCSVFSNFCDFTLHRLIFLPWLPEAKYLPSGENASEYI